METGRQACCPWCTEVFTYGIRALNGDAPDNETDKRFCSSACYGQFKEMRNMRIRQGAKAADEISEDRLLRRLQPEPMDVELYCNSCVARITLNPAVDPTACPECGLPLSRYGPFEVLPSLFGVPPGKESAWRIG